MKTTSERPIVNALFGATRRSILFLLCSNQRRPFYVRQLMNAVGTGRGAVQRELNNLSEAGIVTRVAEGRRVYYLMNPNCPALPELRQLIRKLAGHSHR